MRKYLLLLTLFCCSVVAMAQVDCQVNTDFQNVKYVQVADNAVSLSWQYTPVSRNTEFLVYRYETNAGVTTNMPVRQILATDPCEYDPNTQQKKDPTAQTNYTCEIYGMDLSGSITYSYAVEAQTVSSSGETKTELVFLQQEGAEFKPVTTQACATSFTYTYGLEWQNPALTNQKSNSVTLNWQPYSNEGRYLYTIFGVEHDKVFNTTSETSATITHLEAGVRHEFVVRAYDENGKYVATTPGIYYEPEEVTCVTFESASASNKNVTLTILGYGNGSFPTEVGAYTLTNGDETVTCSNISREGLLTFTFQSIDYNQEFRLETKKGDVKAVGLFELDANGTMTTQYCDIVFDLTVSHITQHTVTLAWENPGFEPTRAVLEYRSIRGERQTIELANPRTNIYELGGLEHSTQYTFLLKLSDQYNNQAKAEVTATTKVGSICGMDYSTSGSTGLGCSAKNGGEFLMPYELEFYTAYHDLAKTDPYVVIRFKPLGTQQINDVKVYATTEKGLVSDIVGITTQSMSKGEDGWYYTDLDKLGWISFLKTDIKADQNIRFSVSVKHNDGCKGTIYDNTYFTKFVSYKVGVGCQDDEIFTIIKFEKVYDRQSEFTLQTNGRMASVGVFTEDGYLGGESFDLSKRIFYNSFDDAPSKFTLDISDYNVGTYYMHIHDVYGEAADLKYLWAIY